MTHFQDEKGFQITVGFPEFAQEIYDQYKAAFEAIKELEPLQHEIFSRPLSEPFHKVGRLLQRQTQTLSAHLWCSC